MPLIVKNGRVHANGANGIIVPRSRRRMLTACRGTKRGRIRVTVSTTVGTRGR